MSSDVKHTTKLKSDIATLIAEREELIAGNHNKQVLSDQLDTELKVMTIRRDRLDAEIEDAENYHRSTIIQSNGGVLQVTYRLVPAVPGLVYLLGRLIVGVKLNDNGNFATWGKPNYEEAPAKSVPIFGSMYDKLAARLKR